jgi:V/A-type H+-transporting ATPase subunit E
MADELQALLERIQAEGIRKIQAERETLLAAARTEAARIVKAAQDEAARLSAVARQENDTLAAKGQAALRQAARDTLLSLRQELQKRVQEVVRRGVGEALSPEALAAILQHLVHAYVNSGGRLSKLEVLLRPEDLARVESGFRARLQEDLRKRVSLQPVPGLKAGFRLVFNGTDVMYDFSDEALAETLTSFLSPKLAELVK